MEIDWNWHYTERGTYLSVVTNMGREAARRVAEFEWGRPVYISCVFYLGDTGYYLFKGR